MTKVLHNVQTAVQKTPLVLVYPSNTRKWFSAYLVLTRVIKLRTFIDSTLETFEQAPVPWSQVISAHSILYEFYWREQLLQGDSAKIIHLAYLWNSLANMFKLLLTEHEGLHTLKSGFDKNQERIESSGYLSFCLANT
jgi:hypothetical protein